MDEGYEFNTNENTIKGHRTKLYEMQNLVCSQTSQLGLGGFHYLKKKKKTYLVGPFYKKYIFSGAVLYYFVCDNIFLWSIYFWGKPKFIPLKNIISSRIKFDSR